MAGHADVPRPVCLDDTELVVADVREAAPVGRPLRVGDVLFRRRDLDRIPAAQGQDEQLPGARRVRRIGDDAVSRMEPELSWRLDRDDLLDREPVRCPTGRAATAPPRPIGWQAAGAHARGHPILAANGAIIARWQRTWPWRSSYAQLNPSASSQTSSVISATARRSRSRPVRYRSRSVATGMPAYASDLRIVPAIDPLRRQRPPAPGAAVLVDCRGGLLEPGGEVPDVVGDRPARRHIGRGPGPGGQPVENRVEEGRHGGLVGPEAHLRRREIRGDRLRIAPERVVLDLADTQPVGPRLEDPQVVDRVAVEDVVDPTPRRVRVDRLDGQPPRDGEEPAVSDLEAGSQVSRREIGEERSASFVERVEVPAVVVVIRRPAPAGPRFLDIVDRKLVPVDDMADVVEEGPVGTARVGRCGAGKAPRRVVEPGPGSCQAIPEGRLVGPEVAIRVAEVDGLDGGERGAPQVERDTYSGRSCGQAAGHRHVSGPVGSVVMALSGGAPRTRIRDVDVAAIISRRYAPRSGSRRAGRRSLPVDRRARPSGGRPPRRPPTGPSGGVRIRARGGRPRSSRRAT